MTSSSVTSSTSGSLSTASDDLIAGRCVPAIAHRSLSGGKVLTFQSKLVAKEKNLYSLARYKHRSIRDDPWSVFRLCTSHGKHRSPACLDISNRELGSYNDLKAPLPPTSFLFGAGVQVNLSSLTERTLDHTAGERSWPRIAIHLPHYAMFDDLVRAFTLCLSDAPERPRPKRVPGYVIDEDAATGLGASDAHPASLVPQAHISPAGSCPKPWVCPIASAVQRPGKKCMNTWPSLVRLKFDHLKKVHELPKDDLTIPRGISDGEKWWILFTKLSTETQTGYIKYFSLRYNVEYVSAGPDCHLIWDRVQDNVENLLRQSYESKSATNMESAQHETDNLVQSALQIYKTSLQLATSSNDQALATNQSGMPTTSISNVEQTSDYWDTSFVPYIPSSNHIASQDSALTYDNAIGAYEGLPTYGQQSSTPTLNPPTSSVISNQLTTPSSAMLQNSTCMCGSHSYACQTEQILNSSQVCITCQKWFPWSSFAYTCHI